MQRLHASRRDVCIQFRQKVIKLTGSGISGDLLFPLIESRRFVRHKTIPKFFLLFGRETVDLLKNAFDRRAHRHILSDIGEGGNLPNHLSPPLPDATPPVMILQCKRSPLFSGSMATPNKPSSFTCPSSRTGRFI